MAARQNKVTKIDSITPKYDVTWYVKWTASFITLVAITIRASGVMELHWLDLVCSWLGACGWFYVGFKWNDRAIMVLNGVIGVILFAGMLRMYFA